ncbi:MAG: cereblon family protein [Proteobacteria bacterium]|nr:cereblon family protein [Pseudomonadota bacterium]
MQLVCDQYGFKKTDFQPDMLPGQDPDFDCLTEENKKLFCSFCKHHVTDIDEAISIKGSHTHTFTNPAGFTYTINCYQAAPGCSIQGESSNEFTWFSGYEWQIAIWSYCQIWCLAD